MKPVEVNKFLTDLIGASAKKVDFEAIENAKRSIVEEVRNQLTPEAKEKLRQDLTFRVVDSEGKQKEKSFDDQQEHAVDTFGSVKRGHGISKEDEPRVRKAMEVIVGHTRKAIDRLTALKLPEDKNKPVEQQRPVYDLTKKEARAKFETFIELEVFTPLVREKILPETLVPDAYSEVQKLLNSTFEKYRGTLQEKLEEEREKDAEALSKVHVEGGRFHAVKKRMYKTKQYVSYLKEKLEPSEETQTKLKIAKAGAKAAWKTRKAFKSVMKMIPEEPGMMPKGVLKQDRFLHPEKYLHDEKYGLNDQRLEELANSKNPNDPDNMRLEMEQQRKENRTIKSLKKLGILLGPMGFSDEDLEKVGKRISAVREIQDEDWAFYTKSALQLLGQTGLGTKGIIESSMKIDSLGDVKEKQLKEQIAIALFQEQAEEAAVEAIETVDAAVTAGVKKAAGPDAGDVFDGIFADQIDEDDVEEAAGKADVDKVVELFAEALRETFVKASPSQLKPLLNEFTSAGERTSQAFKVAALKVLTAEAVKEDAAKAFDALGTAAFDAVAGSLGALKGILLDPKTLKAMAADAVLAEEEEQLEELGKSQEDLKEFERTLTLIDETGVSLAEQRSIEVMIADLQRRKQILKLVNTLGSSLTGIAGTSVNITAWATEQVTDVISGQVGSALKAAKLIIKLAVNVTESVYRWQLFYKFKRDLERSKKAMSSLSSTIQGFFNNKAEQCAFHEMENALTCLQIASAILGTVPEPITMAIGKTMSVCAAAAEANLKVSQMIYDEKRLAEAWTITKAAMDNPRDRTLGLKALRLNPTLGMHAIAWAAVEKTPPDPIARMLLNSLNINEEALAVAGDKAEEKVRSYLLELLDEDRKLDDPSKINVEWAPKDYPLTVAGFFKCVSRGEREAVPKVRPGDAQRVIDALKPVEKQKLDELTKAAEIGDIDPKVAAQLELEAETLKTALNDYRPVAPDGSPHTEMGNIGDTYLKAASNHLKMVREIVLANESARNPSRAFNSLNDLLDEFEAWFGPKGKGPVAATEKDRETIQLRTDSVRKQVQNLRAVKALADNEFLVGKMNEVSLLLDRASRWLAGDPEPQITRVRRGNATIGQRGQKPQPQSTQN